MPNIKGHRYGVRALEDLRQRSVIVQGDSCWHRPASMATRKASGDDPSIWIADLQVAMSIGAAAYYLQHGTRMPPGMVNMRTCDTWGCGNPKHRKLVTRGELAQHRTPGRTMTELHKLAMAAGKRAKSRISDEVAAEIGATTGPWQEVAQRYGVSRSYVLSMRRTRGRRKLVAPNSSVFALGEAA